MLLMRTCHHKRLIFQLPVRLHRVLHLHYLSKAGHCHSSRCRAPCRLGYTIRVAVYQEPPVRKSSRSISRISTKVGRTAGSVFMHFAASSCMPQVEVKVVARAAEVVHEWHHTVGACTSNTQKKDNWVHQHTR